MTTDRYAGCMLGGAVGDALGAPVEFWALRQIREKFGAQGIRDFVPAYGKLGAITDDTQMALFTAEGLLRAESRKRRGGAADYVAEVHQAYLRWLLTQRDTSHHKSFPAATKIENLGWLYRIRELRCSRAPGNTCITSLRGDRVGAPDRPVNFSKGCGGLMRIAPVGLFFDDAQKAFDMGCGIAAITHGHPSGYLSAGAFATMIRLVLDGNSLAAAIESAMSLLKTRRLHQECLKALEHAASSAFGSEPTADSVELHGAGWVAEEALAIAIYCALAADGDFETGVALAVNHSGDSDSTGAIAGNLLGAALGAGSIPPRWLDTVELRSVIESVADDLHVKYREGEEWHKRYPV
jgi:ADP-ribosylglycohydrolase